ncbi:siderophore-interacting protein [Erwiniaceae bacterium BAC15a-03b]|uniref:Siderophore-interacting protein n=1 Tax=Winslowiella arboricola TaxID=2978220 RepID=A0A9J6PXV5_9GAMM|nr:siderophore-interacting protein [Winslowiella arboricola]MCU5775474.1 siderophore-interacting protein [Winslowiella arboricola]MCU5779676.1 siderophore-interacting protein [Winslowiella arboricola]
MTAELSGSSASLKYPQRLRNELRFRTLTVQRCERIASHFQRVVLSGDDLAGFVSAGFDDHTKLFFPQAGVPYLAPGVSDEGIVWPGNARPLARDYTPLFNAARNELTFDFYIHQAGVASDWALQAKTGDTLIIGGPRGSLVVPEDYHWQLYVCDETGMPALLRRLEALSGLSTPVEVMALIAVEDAASKAYFDHLNEFKLEWYIGDEREQIAQRLQQLTVPADDYFLWLTGEGETVKQYSSYFANATINPLLLRAAAYWHRK